MTFSIRLCLMTMILVFQINLQAALYFLVVELAENSVK